MDLHKAIKHLHPDAEFSLNDNDYDQLVWMSKDIDKPSESEVANAWDSYIADRDAVAYKEKRAKEYPDIGDQLDAIMKWAFTENEITLPDELKSLAAQCMSIKSKYPKLES